MKFIRKNLKSLSLFTMMCVVIVSCEKYDVETEPLEQLSKLSDGPVTLISEQYSGEEIFKGIFFMDNKISTEVDKINTYRSDMMKQEGSEKIVAMLHKLRDLSVDYINKNYPDFFDELQEAAYSKNLYALDEKMNESALIIEQAGRTSPDFAAVFDLGDEVKQDTKLLEEMSSLDMTKKEDQAKFEKLMEESNEEFALCVPFIWCALAIFYAFAVAVSIFIFLYSVITKVAYWDVFDMASKSSVGHEQLVSDLGSYFNN